MGRFNALLISLLLLAFGLPLSGQEPAPEVSTTPQRVPPPSENATATELESQGDVLRAQKAYLDSVDYYRVAVKKADSPKLHNKIGLGLFQLHRNSEAKREYERAIKLDKSYPEPHNNLGALYYVERRYGPAIREYKKAIGLNEENASFHHNLGYAYFSEKDYERATKEYHRALELDPNIFDRQPSGGVSVRLVSSSDLGHFHYVMAQMYAQRGDAEHCRYYLAKANEEGYNSREALRENVFAGLRKDPDFVAFVRSLKPPAPEASQ
jgi:tetratricopeptide (TPR) repeat protein